MKKIRHIVSGTNVLLIKANRPIQSDRTTQYSTRHNPKSISLDGARGMSHTGQDRVERYE